MWLRDISIHIMCLTWLYPDTLYFPMLGVVRTRPGAPQPRRRRLHGFGPAAMGPVRCRQVEGLDHGGLYGRAPGLKSSVNCVRKLKPRAEKSRSYSGIGGVEISKHLGEVDGLLALHGSRSRGALGSGGCGKAEGLRARQLRGDLCGGGGRRLQRSRLLRGGDHRPRSRRRGRLRRQTMRGGHLGL